ncbi:MAG: alpha/beta hydrolase [Ruminococcaceae bacterium]|nr:alpha/beta hydrolase [Oscillospiraceae bacterium]
MDKKIEILFEERTFLSADGQSKVHAYIWRPEGVAYQGIIQLSHGMCEYVQRYDAWARRFCAHGYIFCGNDHLGHGHTAPDEDELGYTHPKNGAEYLIEDLHTMTAIMRADYPDLPLVLYGHSMGSFAARAYLTRYGDALSAALISGTAGPDLPTGLGLTVTKMIQKMKGDHHRSKMLTAIAFGSYNNRFKEEQDSFSWLSKDQEVRDKYRADPFCRFVFTTAGYHTMFTLLHTVSDKKWANGVPKSLPLFLFAGDQDPVGGYGKGVRKIYDRLIAAGCEKAKLRLYTGGRHEMHWEPEQETVFEDIIAFLKETIHEH